MLGALVSLDAHATRTRAPEVTASLIVSAISGLFAMGLIGLSVVEYGPLHSYALCMRGANTVTAQNQCQDDFLDSVDSLSGTLSKTR